MSHYIDFVGNIIYFSLFILIVAPEISQSPRDTTEVEGQTAVFNCVVAGYPTPDVAWDKNGVELNVAEHARLRVSSNNGNHRLIISNVQQSDAGQYKCVANNSLDTVNSSSATLTVHCKSNSSFSVKRASVEYSFIWFVGWFFFSSNCCPEVIQVIIFTNPTSLCGLGICSRFVFNYSVA